MKSKIEILRYLESLDTKFKVIQLKVENTPDEVTDDEMFEGAALQGSIEAIEYIMDIKN